MRRQGQYGDADINSMVAAQLHHYQAQQRVQQHPDNSYPPGRDSAQASGERQYAAPKVRQSQWDRGGPNVPSQVPSYSYNEGQGAEGAKSFYDGQRSDPKVGIEKQPNKESREQSRIDRTETRYEDYNLPRTFDSLEQNFHEEIMMLSKELHDAEDAENSRHMEMITKFGAVIVVADSVSSIADVPQPDAQRDKPRLKGRRLKEINAQHQEKLLALRARQATYREEFLRKESLSRQQQYQQASVSHYSNNVVPGEQHGYHPTAVAPPPVAAGGAYGEAQRGYASAQYESFGDRPDYPEFHGGGRGRGRGTEHRSQYPGGRAYNSGGRRF
ncbi:hypothetical protein EJB05_07188 [Eragrostis curvula]|uniref:Uncharacterized protein n=1 Tax=Eragrostis curvula TaxID=38414 RepID=A0A5J9WFT1_9POAL|nr:hypothetical protein EJB05_07188 [Eragrostis curvula]